MALGECDFAEVERRLLAQMSKDVRAYQYFFEEASTLQPQFLAETNPKIWLDPASPEGDKTVFFSWGRAEKRKPWFARSQCSWWGWYIYPHLLTALVAITAYDALWR